MTSMDVWQLVDDDKTPLDIAILAILALMLAIHNFMR